MSTNGALMQSNHNSPHGPLSEREFAEIIKIFPNGAIALDLETTGLSPLFDDIIEFSAVKVTPNNGVELFDQLVNPQREIPEDTIKIHGITDNDVKDSPTILEVLPNVLAFMGDLPLIAHNAKFDLGFIVMALHRAKLAFRKNDVYCTIQWSRTLFPKMPNHRLVTLAKNLKIPLLNHHRALDDAWAALLIFTRGLLDENEGQKKTALKKSLLFSIQDFKKWKEEEQTDVYLTLKKKTRSQQVLDIKYNGGSHRGKYRPIRPISLLPMPAGNVLYAHCLLSDLYKFFSIRKIQEIKILDAPTITNRLEKFNKQRLAKKD
jgi:DNA polymerase III subunit epsilon